MKELSKLKPTGTKTMMFTLLLFLLAINNSQAQEVKEKSKDEKQFDFSVGVNTDTFFGLYTTFQGSYGVPGKTSFTFYGTHWGGGTGQNWGNWTEFGAGINFNVAKGLTVNPQIGILGGNLLSSGTAGPAILGDGFVPSLTVNLLRDKVEGQAYFGYYAPLRDKAPPAPGTTLAYVHYWGTVGYRASNFLSFGVLYEELIKSGGSNVAASSSVYQWLGPYVQFTRPKGGLFARFSFGDDLIAGKDTFYKMTTGFSF